MRQVAEQDWLNREADRLEAAMAAMAVPVRVSGGRIEEGRAHYHATPIGGVQAESIQSLGPGVATALGAEAVAIHAAPGGITIDVSPAPSEPPRLLPIISSLGPYPAMTAVAGVDEHGVPVLLNLLHRNTWHLAVEASQAGDRSAWLRSIVASLAVGSRPSDLQFLGVDLTGAELAFIEALPHALTDVAFRADSAIDLLAWLRDEAERRRSRNYQTPHLVVVIDDLAALARQTGKVALALINRLFHQGSLSGVHVFAGWDPGRKDELTGLRCPVDCARATARLANVAAPRVGDFDIVAAERSCVVRATYLPALDMDRVVRDMRWPVVSGQAEASAR